MFPLLLITSTIFGQSPEPIHPDLMFITVQEQWVAENSHVIYLDDVVARLALPTYNKRRAAFEEIKGDRQIHLESLLRATYCQDRELRESSLALLAPLFKCAVCDGRRYIQREVSYGDKVSSGRFFVKDECLTCGKTGYGYFVRDVKGETWRTQNYVQK